MVNERKKVNASGLASKRHMNNKQASAGRKRGGKVSLRTWMALLALLVAMSMILASCGSNGTDDNQDTQTTADQASTDGDASDTDNGTDDGTSDESDDAGSDETGDTDDSDVTADEDELPTMSIVTSFLPMYIFTANIIDNVPGIELANMAAPETGCLHDYRLMPADMIMLEEADIFIINGANMEGFMGDIAGSMDHLTIIEASLGIELLEDDGHDHDHDHDHDDDHDDDDDDHDGNPHVWLSISLAVEQINNITEALKAIDPQHAAVYQENSDHYVEKLRALNTEMKEALEEVDRREMITFHEAFPYFAEAFGLEIVGVINREPGSEPTAAEVAQTIDLVSDKGIKAVFAEPQYPERIAQTIAEETGAKVYILDPISSGVPSKTLYEEKMRQNMEVLVEALTDETPDEG